MSGWQRRVLPRENGAVEVLLQGEGPLMVMIPSLGRPAEDFSELAARLVAAGWRAAAIEPRGIGASRGAMQGATMADLAGDVAAALDALGERPAAVAGHAFGNRVARMLAVLRPDLAPAVVLLAAGGKAAIPPDIREALVKCFEDLPDAEHMRHVQRAFFAPGNDPGVWRDGWHADVARLQSAATAATPVDQWWSAGTARLLVIQAAQDVVAPAENARLLKDAFGERVTVAILEHAGHAMLPEQPAAIAAIMLDWLRR